MTADSSAIRDAYRRRAREHHPDRGSSASPDEMAAINEAYRVLSDPGRRAVYDRERSGRGPASASGRRGANGAPGSAAPRAGTAPEPAIDATPARMPWKFMAWMFAIGAAVVLLGAAFIEPAAPPGPDGVLRSGSCVAIELNGDAREVSCTGEDDLVVQALVPLDARCPGGTAAHRDRLGLGIACVVPSGSAGLGTVGS